MNRITVISFLLIIIFSLSSIGFAQTIEQKVWLLDNADKISREENIKKAEAESLAVQYKIPIKKTLSDGSIIEIQSFENGMPVYHITDNIIAAATTSTKQLWNSELGGFSLSGNEQTIGLWEVGGTPLFTHQEYNGRVTQKDGGGSASDHASHVAGTLIASGVVPNAKGMSHEGRIDSYTSNSDLSEIMTASVNGLRVSNHSYGLIRGWRFDYFSDGKWAWFGTPAISETEDYQFGFYNNTSYAWDNFLVNSPNILVCKSAGNDRGEGPSAGNEHWVFSGSWVLSNTTREKDGGADGYDGINDPTGIAKNTLTIGAVSGIPNSYNSPSDVVMSSFSNWGPTDDGRIKPDIVADGVGLYSSVSNSNTAYSSFSGTSMASPNVAGSVGLILEQQLNLFGADTPFRSSTLKALIIHSADEAGTFPGPDYIFGWGLMNTYKAVQLMTLDNETGGNNLIREDILDQGNFSEYQVESNGTDPLKVTICWTDQPGTPAPVSLNPSNLMLVNDLDLRVSDPNSTVYQPWVLDPYNPSSTATNGDNIRDNVEQVYIESPIAGTYTIRVNHKGTLTGSSQNFSMVISGQAVSVPDIVTLVEPSNGAQNIFPGQVLFKWERSARSMLYQLQISNDSLFTTTLFDDKVNGVFTTVIDLPSQSTLFWRVRASNSGGNGDWSSINYFTTTLALPQTPELLNPENNAVHQSHNLNFSWSASEWASSYRIQISTSQLFTNLVVDDSTIASNSYLANGLPEGKKLYWKVNAKNTSGTSDFSTRRILTTKLFTPNNLTAIVNENNHVELSWTDSSLIETKYFILRRALVGAYTSIDSLGSNQNSYTDTSVQLGESYYYAVYCKNNTASSDTSNEAAVFTVNVENEDNIIPSEYSIEQNYPNPFNPSTQIKFALPTNSSVRITIYNLLGEVVRELVNTDMNSGVHTVQWNSEDISGRKVSSGIYFYELNANGINGNQFNQVRKMILMK